MTFTVTYREKSGAKAEVEIEASSRAECVAACKRRGIAPMGIREGRSHGARHQMPKSQDTQDRRRIPVMGVLGVLGVLAILVLGIWFFISNDVPTAQPPAEKPKAAKPQPKPRPAPKPAARPAATNAPAAAEAKPVPATNAAPEFVKRPGALQLPDGKVLTFPPPKEGEIRKVYAYGHMYECDHEGNFRDVTKRQLFNTAFEANFLGLAIEDKPFIPAFLKGLDQDDVKKILLKPYEAKGDETEEEMAQLKAYDDMRCAALQFMDEGGSFDDFVDYFAKQVKEERETNALCLREVMTLYKQGKLDEAKEMAEAANALKRQKGLKELKLPAHVREKLGL